ncbi:MAG: hypothetical protein SOR89_02465 [Ndongobacter sp.]|nr:hypothetical protein [Ndongobacter sp.]
MIIPLIIAAEEAYRKRLSKYLLLRFGRRIELVYSEHADEEHRLIAPMPRGILLRDPDIDIRPPRGWAEATLSEGEGLHPIPPFQSVEEIYRHLCDVYALYYPVGEQEQSACMRRLFFHMGAATRLQERMLALYERCPVESRLLRLSLDPLEEGENSDDWKNLLYSLHRQEIEGAQEERWFSKAPQGGYRVCSGANYWDRRMLEASDLRALLRKIEEKHWQEVHVWDPGISRSWRDELLSWADRRMILAPEDKKEFSRLRYYCDELRKKAMREGGEIAEFHIVVTNETPEDILRALAAEHFDLQTEEDVFYG